MESTVRSGDSPIHDRSPPAQNAVPSPVTTTARTDRSLRRLAMVSPHALVSSAVIALRRSGSARVRITTPSSRRVTRRGLSVMDRTVSGDPHAQVAGLFTLSRVALAARPTGHGRRSTQGGPMAESYEGYCVKCKEKRTFDGEVRVSDSGRRMAQGTCPVCGTKMNRILGKA